MYKRQALHYRINASWFPCNRIYPTWNDDLACKPWLNSSNLMKHKAVSYTHLDGTVLNALLYHYPPIAEVPRAGIVHRLDKDTTGLMVCLLYTSRCV